MLMVLIRITLVQWVRVRGVATWTPPLWSGYSLNVCGWGSDVKLLIWNESVGPFVLQYQIWAHGLH